MTIGVVSLACRYPDANAPASLWRNVVEGRRSFRSIPTTRLDLAQYAPDRIGEADSITKIRAGLLADWQFDCARFRIPQSTFEATDLSHWLALEVAADAIEACGGANKLGRARTAVVVANTLTGEFSRAAMLRLRIPFLDGLLAQALQAANLRETQSMEVRQHFLDAVRECFPTPQEETLAGGLANTIAGRVANYFDFAGGAYTVDAACASSLVAIANAADLLSQGAVDAVVVGTVDLSLDPFELVGFSRNGALAVEDMRVFDRRAAGFWPGEGAAFAVLMRADEARRRQLPIRAVIRGWGISTDGAGGFTRPSVEGQVVALQRAYERAEVDPVEVGYVEAHGTGTAVGDPVEVQALARMRRGLGRSLPIGSIKANIGHTKAAAGFAGLIKSVAALETGLIPPHVGCEIPHPVFRDVDDCVRPALAPERWPDGTRIAAVSAFGFGGINAHVVLEGKSEAGSVVSLPSAPRRQEAELFVFAGERAEIVTQMQAVAARASALTTGEFVDAAAHLAGMAHGGPIRVAITASHDEELAAKLVRSADAVETSSELMDFEQGVCVGHDERTARLGFLFPGQATRSPTDGGCWARRFDNLDTLLAPLPVAAGANAFDTRIVQPAVAAASLAALRVLRACNIEASIGCGHSLGELTALTWAGALSEEDLIRLVAARGAAMAVHGRSGGGMLRIVAAMADVQRLIDGLDLTIACQNGPLENVVSGANADIARAQDRAHRKGFEVTPLAVSHAFHNPMMAPAAEPFAAVLTGFKFGSTARRVLSTVTGNVLEDTDDLQELLVRQLVAPVRFDEATRRLAAETDFLIEVGPGSGLTRLARQAGHSALSIDAFGESLRPLLTVLGAAFVRGQPVDFAPLFRDRTVRPVDLARRPQLLANPCGRSISPSPGDAAPATITPVVPSLPAHEINAPANFDEEGVLEAIRRVLAEETGFTLANIGSDDRFLDDLHLNSIAVTRIVTKVARLTGSRIPDSPTAFANATVSELAAELIAMGRLEPDQPQQERVPGVRPWVRTFAVRWAEQPLADGARRTVRWKTVVVQGDESDNAAARHFNVADEPDGLLIWVGANADEQSTYEIFGACRAARSSGIAHLAICHVGAAVSAFARSLAIEKQFATVLVMERPLQKGLLDNISQELNSQFDGFREVRLDIDGSRFEPYFALIAPEPSAAKSWGPDDVVLVTGGAKGIGAECALRLAAKTGAAILLVGRSAPSDAAVAATLARASAGGIRCEYAMADVTQPEELASAVAKLAGRVGPITALVHAAGMNEPQLFQNIGDRELKQILEPKTVGFRNAVAAAGPGLRRVVAFGSILGRMGLKGETHYAIANAWQSTLAEQIARERPRCEVLSLEWSIWNGAGMGHRLGALEGLARHGVDAISLDDGVDEFERLVIGGATGSLIVTSRFGPPRYVSLDASDLPSLRFVDRTLLHYPKLELVVETELSLGRDPYLSSHRVGGLLLLPGVFGLEAMAQVASALVGRKSPAAAEGVSFPEAIVVPDHKSVRLRILALAHLDGRVEVTIRSDEDAFTADRMRATFSFTEPAHREIRKPSAACSEALIDATPLYGPLFFQGDRLRRVANFSLLSARKIVASLSSAEQCGWFSTFEPQHLVLGDPAARDALLHCLQAAVPHLRVVPVLASAIAFCAGGPPVRVEATEQEATDRTFTFDIRAFDSQGQPVEWWQGATFRAIEDIPVDDVILAAPQITGPYIERIARSTMNESSIEVALVSNRDLDRNARRAHALEALRLDGPVFSRSDGMPIVVGGGQDVHLSISHCKDVTLAVKACREIGCDIELVSNKPENGANGHYSMVAQAFAADLADSEDDSIRATRLWALNEVEIKQNRRLSWPYKTKPSLRSEIVSFETVFGRTATIHIATLAGGVVVAIGTSDILSGATAYPHGADHASAAAG